MKKEGKLAKRFETSKAFPELFSQRNDNFLVFEAMWYSRDGNKNVYFMGYKNVVTILLEWFLKPSDDNRTIYSHFF